MPGVFNCDEPLVSVVVPVHNSSHTLETCIKALVHQDYEAIEIILVENGSSDDSASQCRFWAEMNPNILYLEIEQASVTAARNAGIEAAHGEYIAFCDADDWYKPSAINILVRSAAATQAGVVKAGYMRVINECIPISKGRSFVKNNTLTYRSQWTYDDYARFYNPIGYAFPSAMWSSLFSRELLQSIPICIRENGLRRGEDALVNAAAMSSSDSTLFIPDCIYCYRYGGVTATNENLINDLFSYKALLDELFGNDPHPSRSRTDIEFARYCLEVIVKRFQNGAALSSTELRDFYESCLSDPRINELAQRITSFAESNTEERKLAEIVLCGTSDDLFRFAQKRYRKGRLITKTIFFLGGR